MIAKCFVVQTLRNKMPCTNDAITINQYNKPICAECIKEANYLTNRLNFLKVKLGINDPPIIPIKIPSNN